jgi:hypothetical protein
MNRIDLTGQLNSATNHYQAKAPRSFPVNLLSKIALETRYGFPSLFAHLQDLFGTRGESPFHCAHGQASYQVPLDEEDKDEDRNHGHSTEGRQGAPFRATG